MTAEHIDTEVVVVGLGTSGSMALWQLAKRGVKAVGIEQFGVGHARGSYAGDSRLFRTAVHEGARFIPLLLRARELWRELEADSGHHLYTECGVLQIGEAGTPSLDNCIAGAREYDLPHELLDAADLRARYGQHRVEDDTVAILDKQAGYLHSPASVLAAVEAAKAHGASVVTGAEVVDFDEEGGRLKVVTPEVVVHCDKVIVATGSWTLGLRPDLKSSLTVLPIALTWFMPRHVELFAPDVFPAFIRDEAGVHLYGVPSHDGYSVKISGEPAWPAISTPDDIPAMSRNDITTLSRQAQSFLPDLNPEPVRWSMHHDLCTASGLPIVDHDEDTGIVLMAGFSGRGAKFAPAYGELAADIVMGKSSSLYDSGFALSAHH